jgi:transcriptional regulator with XRE-family HTH domain
LEQLNFQTGTISVPNYRVAFSPTRLSDLRKAKGLERGELAELSKVSGSQVTKHENGDASSIEIILKFADALDCTLDYLYERGEQYESPSDAAIRMSFDVFSRDAACSNERRERCRHVLRHEEPPRTAHAWKVLAEQIELAIGPTGNGGHLRILRSGG